MLRDRHHYRKPDPLLLLAVAVALAAMMTSAVQAGEPSLFYSLAQPAFALSVDRDQGFTVARVGEDGGNLHVSLSPPPDVIEGIRASGGSEADLENLNNVFLSVRFPW